MEFRNLDETTRKYMAEALKEDEAAGKIGSKNMTGYGLSRLPSLLREAILHGNEETLEAAMADPAMWKERDSAGKRVSVEGSRRRLAITEFGIMYTRGLCRRLKAEGETQCRIYRAGRGIKMRCKCTAWEGKLVYIDELLESPRDYDGPGIRIPSGANCHHSICRASG